LRDAAEKFIASGKYALWTAPELRAAIEAALALVDVLAPSELNKGEQQAIDRLKASLDPPKPLEGLRIPPTQNVLGYEQHHVVEQNPNNIAKSAIEAAVEKFGREAIDDPDNLVWIPRLKHELITTYYNSKNTDNPAFGLHRRVINDMDYDAQYQAGLEALRIFGVLK
jgi:A nuclease family of the HNH/ENDO VII superfamily with conserved AHH